MLCVYGHYKYFTLSVQGPSVFVRICRLKTVHALKGLIFVLSYCLLLFFIDLKLKLCQLQTTNIFIKDMQLQNYIIILSIDLPQAVLSNDIEKTVKYQHCNPPPPPCLLVLQNFQSTKIEITHV